MIVFVVECPAPYHTPVLNRLHEELGDRLRVFYLSGADIDHGWGEVAATHRYVALDRPGGRAALLETLLSSRLEAVCVYGYRGAARVAAASVARVRRLPLVLRAAANVRTERSRPRWRRTVKRWYLRILLGQPEVWSNGSANAAYWSELGLRRQHLIPYALPHLPGGAEGAPALRERLGIDDRFVFTYVGRLEPVKGVTDLLEAYEIVRENVPEAATALVIAGRGAQEPRVRAYAGARDDCHYLGAIPQERLGAVHAAGDVLVVPSHSETWCWVVNEALGFGTRVIATHEVAAADDLVDEATGCRCPAADPPALAAAMIEEYKRGRRRAPRLACVDTAQAMAHRLDELTRLTAR